MYQDHSAISLCKEHRILIEAYSPLAQFKKDVIEHPVLVEAASTLGLDVPRTILSYLLHKGFIVLPRSSKEDHIRSNIQLGGITLPAEVISAIDKLSVDNSLKVCWDSKDVL